MVIEIILAALAAAAAGSAVVALGRRRRERGLDAAEGPPQLRAPRQLDAGELVPRDVVTHLGADHLIEGVATLREGGEPVVVAAFFTEAGRTRCLLIDLVGRPRCAMTEARDVGALGASVPGWVQDGAFELGLTRRAAVRVRCEGRCPELPSPEGACEYGLYHGPGQRRGAMLLSDEGALLLIGQAVTEAGLVLLPGGSVPEAEEG